MQEHFEKVIGRLRTLEGLIERLQTVEGGGGADPEDGGYIEIPDSSWSYASATTITVPSGAASIYAVGDQVRYKQGGAYKFGSIITVADTLLTVTGGTDYSVANAAITDAAFSKGGGVGFPTSFNWTPTFAYSGGTTDPTSMTPNMIFTMTGSKITVTGQLDMVRGSGDRTVVLLSNIPGRSTTRRFSGSVSQNVVSATRQQSVIRSDSRIIIEHGAMTRDGNYFLSVTYIN